jgi:hypothetical protein
MRVYAMCGRELIMHSINCIKISSEFKEKDYPMHNTKEKQRTLRGT